MERTQAITLGLGGTLDIGEDTGSAVDDAYTPPVPVRGGHPQGDGGPGGVTRPRPRTSPAAERLSQGAPLMIGTNPVGPTSVGLELRDQVLVRLMRFADLSRRLCLRSYTVG